MTRGWIALRVFAALAPLGCYATFEEDPLEVPDTPDQAAPRAIIPGAKRAPAPRTETDTQVLEAITFQRSSCYGGCQEYAVTIGRDGAFTFEGLRAVTVMGKAQGRIDRETAASLLSRFASLDSLGDPPKCHYSDTSQMHARRLYVRRRFRGRPQQRESVVVCGAEAFESVRAAVREAERAVDIDRWTGSLVDCLPSAPWSTRFMFFARGDASGGYVAKALDRRDTTYPSLEDWVGHTAEAIRDLGTDTVPGFEIVITAGRSREEAAKVAAQRGKRVQQAFIDAGVDPRLLTVTVGATGARGDVGARRAKFELRIPGCKPGDRFTSNPPPDDE